MNDDQAAELEMRLAMAGAAIQLALESESLMGRALLERIAAELRPCADMLRKRRQAQEFDRLLPRPPLIDLDESFEQGAA